MLSKVKSVICLVVVLLMCTSCAEHADVSENRNSVFAGNIQNGGSVVAYEHGYIYADLKNGIFAKFK